jgi:hypothetical protein
MGEVLDEAVINTPWGGGWLVAVVRAGRSKRPWPSFRFSQFRYFG